MLVHDVCVVGEVAVADCGTEDVYMFGCIEQNKN